ncbi:MAG: histidine phosphatase family protein [Bacteroidota bacterium]
MKTLYLIRHAKSSWKYDHLADIDRPLNKRGQRDAPEMGKRLKARGIYPDLMISSPANRALTTCKTVADALNYAHSDIKIEDTVYHGSESALLKAVHSCNDSVGILFLFGHNPGLTDFANELTHSDIWNIPTCGIFGCTFDVDHWSEVKMGGGVRIFYDFPKSFKNGN